MLKEHGERESLQPTLVYQACTVAPSILSLVVTYQQLLHLLQRAKSRDVILASAGMTL
jgi:hypothetical protein